MRNSSQVIVELAQEQQADREALLKAIVKREDSLASQVQGFINNRKQQLKLMVALRQKACKLFDKGQLTQEAHDSILRDLNKVAQEIPAGQMQTYVVKT